MNLENEKATRFRPTWPFRIFYEPSNFCNFSIAALIASASVCVGEISGASSSVRASILAKITKGSLSLASPSPRAERAAEKPVFRGRRNNKSHNSP